MRVNVACSDARSWAGSGSFQATVQVTVQPQDLISTDPALKPPLKGQCHEEFCLWFFK